VHDSAFKATTKDVKGYAEVLDANRDGQVTLADLETLAVQYLCGPGVLSAHSFDNAYKKPKYEASNVSTSYATSLIKPNINAQ
jgi:sorbitol-specific phosphotransferase system component IIC